MTTQAQIDAAISAYHRKREGDTEDDRMKAALIAAAEVERPNQRDAEIEQLRADNELLAGRFGRPPFAAYEALIAERDRLEAELAATIERCAQEVEKLDGTVIGPYYRRAAAAIRALKDSR